MSYLVLARKWRPKQFDEVVGQRPIIQTLKNSISSGRIAHAYLFSGPRGVGKTTTARILAKSLNCNNGPTPKPCDDCILCQEINKGSSIDVIEIDGASNNSVDDIRDLREKVHYLPAKGRYKVYIIDEVHMLSNQAFNALLKTLEEPPQHIVFILATTEVHKIPLTILSRCQRYDFRKISSQDIRDYLEKLLKQEGNIKGDREGALRLIARSADGSLRDALSLTDQMLAFSDGQITLGEILDLVSLINRETIADVLRAVITARPQQALGCVEGIVDRGHNLKQFVEQILQYLRDIIVFKLVDNPERFLEISLEETKEIEDIAQAASHDDLLRYFDLLTKAAERMKASSQPRLILEMTLLRMADLPRIESIKDIIQKLSLLEKTNEIPWQGQEKAPIGNYQLERVEAKDCAIYLEENDSPTVPDLKLSKDKIIAAEGLTLKGKESTCQDSHEIGKDLASSAPDLSNQGPSGAPSLQDKSSKPFLDKPPLKEKGEETGLGLNWPIIIQQVKDKSMALGSILEQISAHYQEGSTILELALKDNNPFYLQMIEDKKNRAILQAVLTQVSGKKLEVRWTYKDKAEAPALKTEAPLSQTTTPEDPKSQSPLELINQEPLVQMAMEIFSAEIIKTNMAKGPVQEEETLV